MTAKEAIESLRELIDSLKNHNRDSDFGIKPSIAAERFWEENTIALLGSVFGVLERQSKVLDILRKRAKKIAEFPGQEKEPDIQITVMSEADGDYEAIMKWMEEEE